MKKLAFYISLFAICQLWVSYSSADNSAKNTEVVHHSFEISISPKKNRIKISDTISVPENMQNTSLSFRLNKAFKIEKSNVPIETTENTGVENNLGTTFQEYRLSAPIKQLSLSYSGTISLSANPADQVGIISEDGIFLDSSSGWFPVFADELFTFELDITVPKDYTIISQGTRRSDTHSKRSHIMNWEETQAQNNIYIVGGAVVEFNKSRRDLTAHAFMRSFDKKLTEHFLQATFDYIDMYNELIGPYPYSKFALIENSWESGFSMPSFTLLGPKLIRMPETLYTSYPHEILHNWWGNSVYVDYETGNWAEGLTAYLSDHLYKEQQHVGAHYRREILQTYTDFARTQTEFPLAEFRSKHSKGSEAIGYGKALMFFHMLRLKIGDEKFKDFLKAFFAQGKFKINSYDDMRTIVEGMIGKSFEDYFLQWVKSTGAPSIELVEPVVDSISKQLIFTLRQTQDTLDFQFDIPIEIWSEADTPENVTVTLAQREQKYVLNYSHMPVAMKVDPGFDVFRRLSDYEIPSALGLGFGENKIVAVISSDENAQAYENMVKTWAAQSPANWTIAKDKDINEIPQGDIVWLLGWNNKFMQRLPKTGMALTPDGVIIENQTYTRDEHSVVLTNRNDEMKTIIWVAAKNNLAIQGLTRKLPQYKPYSYLVFRGNNPENIRKGQWETTMSPLNYVFDQSYPIRLSQPAAPLAPSAF
ncbi:MAG: M1 family aminopeptidase [Gammaproteobacteria bacterium]|nr:M1 family aminopeptidase [Gammaproteobacteria bacterium]